MLQGGNDGQRPPGGNNDDTRNFWRNALNNMARGVENRRRQQQENNNWRDRDDDEIELNEVRNNNDELPSNNQIDDLDPGDYRDIVRLDLTRRDATQILDSRNVTVTDVMDETLFDNIRDPAEFRTVMNRHLRNITRGVPTHILEANRGFNTNVDNYNINGGNLEDRTEIVRYMPRSRAILESRLSILNYLQFMESTFSRLANGNRLARPFVANRHREMMRALRQDILTNFDELLGIPVYDFSDSNNIDSFKTYFASEVYMSFAYLKYKDLRLPYEDYLDLMFVFAAQEYMRSDTINEYIRRDGLFIERSNIRTINTLRGSQPIEKIVRPSLQNISPENYRKSMLMRLFYNWLQDGRLFDKYEERRQQIVEVLGFGLDFGENQYTDEELISIILDADVSVENYNKFYNYVRNHVGDDPEVNTVYNYIQFFMNDEQSLQRLLNFMMKYLNQSDNDFYEQVLGHGYMERGNDESFIAITKTKFNRSTEIGKIKMIVQGGIVEDFESGDGTVSENYFQRYFKGFGLDYIQIIVDYMAKRDTPEFAESNESPQIVLSPVDEGSPASLLSQTSEELRENLDRSGTLIELLRRDNPPRDVTMQDWIYPLTRQQLIDWKRYADGNITVDPRTIFDPDVDIPQEIIDRSLSDPITIRGVKGMILKRYIMDGFFNVIPNTSELIDNYIIQLKKIFRGIFRRIYGDAFLQTTGLYSDTDRDLSIDKLDIDMYDLIPYHSITLKIRRVEGDEDVLFNILRNDEIDFNNDDIFINGTEISTRFMKKPLYDLIEKLSAAAGRYNETYNIITEIRIDILEIYNKTLAFGKLRSAYDLGGRSIPMLKDRYILIDTTTEQNCLYACCFTAIEFEENYKILQNEKARQNGAFLLKSRIMKNYDLEGEDSYLLDTIDENNEYQFNNVIYQALADYFGRDIEIYNNVFIKFREFTTSRSKKKQPIRIQVHLMHAVLMIEKSYFEEVYNKQALVLKTDYVTTLRNYYKRDLGIDQCNNLVRALESSKSENSLRNLSRAVVKCYEKLNVVSRDEQKNISEQCEIIYNKYLEYRSCRNYFKNVISPEVIKGAIGQCRILEDKEPWLEVRETNKGNFWIEAYRKQFTKDEFDFLISNKVIEFNWSDTVGHFELLEKKKGEDSWYYKLGSIDLETTPDKNKYQITYAGGLSWWRSGVLMSYPEVDYNTDIECVRKYNNDEATALTQIFDYLYEHAEQFDGFIFYAHNGGKFDFPIMIAQYLSSNSDKWSIKADRFVEMNGAIMSLTLRCNGKTIVKTDRNGEEYEDEITITFRDFMRLIPGSLARICEELKVPHQKLIYPKDDPRYVDHEMINLDNFKDLLWKIDPYLENDCKGLLECVTLFSYNVFKDMHINISNCLTNATLAKKNFFQNYYNPSKYPIYNLPYSFDQILRSCYAGGRVESFVLGKVTDGKLIDDETSPYYGQRRIFYYDVTSEYPDQGRRDLPYGIPKMISREEASYLYETHLVEYTDENGVVGNVENDYLKDECFGFVEVELYCDMTRAMRTRVKPVHHLYLSKDHELVKDKEGPDRKHLANTLLFPWFKSTVRMWICSEEIKYCQKLNLPYIYRVLNVMQFEKAPFLKELFEDCAKKKEEAGAAGNKCMRQAWKIVMNSTYGFFALRVSNRDSVIVLDKQDALNWRRYLRDSRLKNIAQYPKYTLCRLEKDINIKDLNVAVAAFITSYSRMKLHNIITKIESTGHRVYYVDTDSVITNCPLNLCPKIDAELRWDGDGSELGSLKNEASEKITGVLEGQLMKSLFPDKTKETLTKDDRKLLKDTLNKKLQLEQDREYGMEAGFSEGYFMGSKMYYCEMDKVTPEGEKIFYTACAFKGFKKDDYIDFEKKVRSGKCDKGNGEFLSDVFEKLHQGEVYTKDQTQFRGGKTSLMNEHTRGGIRTQWLPKKFKKYYIKGVQLPTLKSCTNIIPHTL